MNSFDVFVIKGFTVGLLKNNLVEIFENLVGLLKIESCMITEEELCKFL